MKKIWGEIMNEEKKKKRKVIKKAENNKKKHVKKSENKKDIKKTVKKKETKKSENSKVLKKKVAKKVENKKEKTHPLKHQKKSREKRLIIPNLEPSKTVDFEEYDDFIGLNTKEWEEKREQLLEEHELRLQGQEIKEELDDSSKNSNLALVLIVAFAIIVISFTFITNAYRKELQRQIKEANALNELQDSKNENEDKEEVITKVMTCSTAATQIDNYQNSVLSISNFENDTLTSYEYIITKKYNDQGSYDSAKLENQNQNDILFDNNQLIIKTYFGHGHVTSVPQETTYLGKSLQEVKAQEESTGATCTISE